MLLSEELPTHVAGSNVTTCLLIRNSFTISRYVFAIGIALVIRRGMHRRVRLA